MSRKRLVSVIIIFLNAEQFIQEAIESVFAQTYHDWELLLIDDGSIDGSSAIARKYAEQHPEQVRYLEHDYHVNRGMSASRNLGICQARADYIAFLDADDVWLSHKLEQQVAILDSHPEAAMVYGLSQWWYSWAGNVEDQDHDYVHQLGVTPNTLIRPPALLPLFFFRQQAAIPSPSSILMRRDVMERIGGFEEGFLGIYQAYEDQAFYAKLGLAASVIPFAECWDRYRQHPDSCVSSVQQARQEYTTRLYFLNWLATYMSNHAIRDPGIWRGLRKEQWRCRYLSLYRVISNPCYRICEKNSPLQRIVRHTLPAPARRWLWARWHGQDYSPPAGWVRFGSLRRLTPFSREFGFDRGLPIDRYYIERFLATHIADIHGHVLEVEDDIYTRQFGGERVTKSDVLHIRPGEPKATIVADLTRANNLPCETFDCIMLTQTLQFIYDVRAAITTVYRILKPGGVVLATVPGISHISRYDMERWGHFWAFTTQSARRLFEEVFPATNISIEAHGNVLASSAFLYGMASQELQQKELDACDPDYELIITVRAVKSANGHRAVR